MPALTLAAAPLYSPMLYSGRNSMPLRKCVQMLSDPRPVDLAMKSCPVFLRLCQLQNLNGGEIYEMERVRQDIALT